jgi:alpha-L-fucosidase
MPEINATPTPQQLAYADAELGAFIHYDIEVFQPEWWEAFTTWSGGKGPRPARIDLDRFNPRQLDTDQWVQAAVAAGAKYAVLTAKHNTGFSLWPTAVHEYSVRNTPWRKGEGDIVREFVASCRRYGVKPGVYYSTATNFLYDVADHGLNYVNAGDSDKIKAFNAVVLKQCEEIWGNYGELIEHWFDGNTVPPEKGGPDLVPLLRKLQPNMIAWSGPEAIVNRSRNLYNEQGFCMEDCWSTDGRDTSSLAGDNGAYKCAGNPDSKVWSHAEATLTVRDQHRAYVGGWFWRAGEDHLVADPEYLFARYCDTVGRNANLLINLTPDDRGLIPDADVKAVTGLGRLIRERLGTPLAETPGTGREIKIELPEPRRIERIMLMEDQSQGHRVREWTVEGKACWGTWWPMASGRCMGHKRILSINQFIAKEIRLRITQAVGEPVIRRFAVFGK